MERIKIPVLPRRLLDADASHIIQFAPDGSLNRFIRETVLNEASQLFNLEHNHLLAASIGFLWTNTPNKRRMKRVVEEAEMPNFKGGAWQKARQEKQFIDWFGSVPDFVITFNAGYRAE